MPAYTGETQRLKPPDDLTLLSDLLTTNSQIAIQASHKITYQTWTLDAARRYLVSARRLLEEYQRYQQVAERFPSIELPPQITAVLQEVQR
jgi:hypothetical protein